MTRDGKNSNLGHGCLLYKGPREDSKRALLLILLLQLFRLPAIDGGSRLSFRVSGYIVNGGHINI